MAIVVKARTAARITRGKSPQAEQDFVIRRDTNRELAISEQEAEQALLLNTDDVAAALLRNQISVEQTASPSVWYGKVIWRVDPIPSESAPLRWSGSSRGSNQRIFRSLSTRGVWTRPATLDGAGNPLTYRTARELNGAIEVDEDNNVQGVDVGVGDHEWSLTVYVPADSFTDSYRSRLIEFSWSTNSRRWHGFDPGAVLFKYADWDFTLEGGSVDPTQAEPKRLVQITYYFKAGVNETLEIGDCGARTDAGTAIPITKRAHDHLWIEWQEELDEATQELTRRPAVVRVEQVYPERNFSALGLGGDFIDA